MRSPRYRVRAAFLLACVWPAWSAAQSLSMPALESSLRPTVPAKSGEGAASLPRSDRPEVKRSSLTGTRTPANDHVTPAAPASLMPPMMKGMAMGDSPWLGMLLANELEWVGAPQGLQAGWDIEGWLGTPTQKLWLESEGSASSRDGAAARNELLFDHAFSRFWDWRVGYRQDLGAGPGRGWLAAGIQGLAPYWFELEAMAYVSAQGRLALRFEARHDVLLTQRLILTPKFETQLYSRGDPQRALGGGLSELDLGLRLRYEVSRKLAPYLGVGWVQRVAANATWAGRQQQPGHGLEWMTGVRLWF